MIRKTAQKGFSLVEVSLAIVVAAGGLLAVFSYFPMGLRQSTMSKADMVESSFAGSFFDIVEANVSTIDDVTTWNNLSEFWNVAIDGTGIAAEAKGPFRISQLDAQSNVSDAVKDLLYSASYRKSGETYSQTSPNRIPDDLGGNGTQVYYVYRESDSDSTGNGTLMLPPQFIIRILQLDNNTVSSVSKKPVCYAISIVSSQLKAPSFYTGNSLYHTEFYFTKRP